MPPDVLCMIYPLCSPWTKCCLAASCTTLRTLAKSRNDPSCALVYTGLVSVRECTFSNVTATSFSFTCRTPYGSDQPAEQQLSLMVDYWDCVNKKHAPCMTTSPDGRATFTGTLVSSRCHFTRGKLLYETDSRRHVQLQERFYRDVVVHVHFTVSALQIKLRSLKEVVVSCRTYSAHLLYQTGNISAPPVSPRGWHSWHRQRH